jgi:hypothetical protein
MEWWEATALTPLSMIVGWSGCYRAVVNECGLIINECGFGSADIINQCGLANRDVELNRFAAVESCPRCHFHAVSLSQT